MSSINKQYTFISKEVYDVFVKPDEVVEIRVLIGRNIWCGYFDNHESFCKALNEINQWRYHGCYFTLQVIDPRLLARACNRMKEGDLTTSDRDVISYRWLPIDLDPVRPAGISSSESELKMAMDLRLPIATWVMQEYGFSKPIMAMSGNGGHVLFRLPDWPANNEHKAIIKGILEDISSRFSTNSVSIDTKVFNPARIWKLYGSTAKKGDEIPATKYREARLYRMAYIDDLGGEEHGD